MAHTIEESLERGEQPIVRDDRARVSSADRIKLMNQILQTLQDYGPGMMIERSGSYPGYGLVGASPPRVEQSLIAQVETGFSQQYLHDDSLD